MYAIAVLVIGNQKVGIASSYLSSVCFFVLRVTCACKNWLERRNEWMLDRDGVLKEKRKLQHYPKSQNY